MRPDADLQTLVIHTFTADPHIDETSIGVTVHHGVVTLTGTVAGYAEKHDVARVAHRVPGVLDVANEIEVRPGWQRRPTDADVAEAIRNALAAEPRLKHERILSTVGDRGHVRLEGAVETPRERELAEITIRMVSGVELVTNLLDIAP